MAVISQNHARHSKRPHRWPKTSDLPMLLEGWVIFAEASPCARGTILNYRGAGERLIWFLKERRFTQCGPREIEAFIAYLYTGHAHEGGRWGEGTRPRGHGQMEQRPYQPMAPITVRYYYARLRTWFNWMISRGEMEYSPLAAVPPPRVRADQIQPFTEGQVQAILAAAKQSRYAARNVALIYFLYDTGARASETVGLTLDRLDLRHRFCRVVGKGNRERTLYFSARTNEALWTLVGRRKAEPRERHGVPVFVTQPRHGEVRPLTGGALTEVIKDLGRRAGIEIVRCTPHTFRHTMAIEFLRGGGNVFTLREMLGHESLTMTQRYVMFAQADLKHQHAQFSPVDRLFRNNGR